MSWRFICCVMGVAISGLVPLAGYANEQACDALVAVSYIDPSLSGETQAHVQQLDNFNAEFIQALGQAAQLAISLEPKRGRKALVEARSGRVDLIIGVSLTPEEEAQLDYLQPAYIQKTYRLWLRVGEQRSLKYWPELAGLRGVRVLQSAGLESFDLQVELLNWPMSTMKTLDAAVDKVLEGQADYLLAEQQELLEQLDQRGLLQEFEVIEPAVETQSWYVALSKDSACNTAKLRSTLSTALVKLSKLD